MIKQTRVNFTILMLMQSNPENNEEASPVDEVFIVYS